ncbi:MAG: rhodanese-like domain-containing protein [Gammaproteobacteria bacterium]|nr:rhodanese-like domain-containing protein [Gammaproteobacteria bacterium]
MRCDHKIIVITFLILGGPVSLAATPEKSEPLPIAKFCAGCHQPEPGIMRGFLDNISVKAKTIQMSFVSHKDTVRFADATKLKNVKSFEDMRRYKNKGFRIKFREEQDGKYATEITRFAILKTVSAEEKLTKESFKNQFHNENVAIYDVRPPMKYKAAHIPGAKPLPAPAFDKFAKTLPENKDTPLILYGPGGCLSPTTSIRAKSLGYTNVKIYTRGFPDWSKTEYSVTTPDWLKMAINNDAAFVLIDVRPEETARQGHIEGAVSVPLGRIDESKDSFPRKKNAPIVVYGQGKEEAAKKIISWGYRAVRILPISYAQWKESGNPVQTGPVGTRITYKPKPKPGTITIEEFIKTAKQPPADVLLVDVRNPEETDKGAIEHAVNIPTEQVRQRLTELPSDREVVFFCPNGVRAEMAYNMLKTAGRKSRYLDASIRIDEDGNFKIMEN